MSYAVRRIVALVTVAGVLAAFGWFLWGRGPAAQATQYRSPSVYVYNLTDDVEVLDVNGRAQRAPASLVKLMTVYVTLQHVNDLSQPAPVDRDAYLGAVNANASMAGFVTAEATTYRDLLYGTMIASGGEAAGSLAVHTSGSTDAFVAEMNTQAETLGLTSTHFANPAGYDADGQHTSARDVAMLLRAGLENGHFRVLLTTPQFTTSSTLDHPDGLNLTHTVLSRLADDPGEGFTIVGGKSGTTVAAGHCWATLVEKDGKEYIVVVMGAPLADEGEPGDAHILDTLEIAAAL